MSTLRASLFFVITLSILILISGLLLYKNLTGLLTAWNQSNKMVIYLNPGATAEGREKLLALIRAEADVREAQLITREQAAEMFQKSLPDFSAGLASENDLRDLVPETVEIDLDSTLALADRAARFARLKETLLAAAAPAAAGQPAILPAGLIDEVHYGADGLQKFARADRVLRTAGAFVFLVMLSSISYLIALMVRVLIEDSRQEIEVYSLLGATRWSIYKIFLRDVFVFLLASLFAAFTLLFLIFIYVRGQLATSGLAALVTDNLRFLSFPESLTTVLLLFVFIYVSSFIAIRNSVTRMNQLHD